MLYRPLSSPASWGTSSPRSERGYAGSWIRTSEKTSSRTFVNKGKKKGRGCYYAPALVRHVALTVRSTHGTARRSSLGISTSPRESR